MSENNAPAPKPYTEKQYDEFNEAVDLASSPNQVERIQGRMRLSKLRNDLTKDVCDIMWERSKIEFGGV